MPEDPEFHWSANTLIPVNTIEARHGEDIRLQLVGKGLRWVTRMLTY